MGPYFVFSQVGQQVHRLARRLLWRKKERFALTRRVCGNTEREMQWKEVQRIASSSVLPKKIRENEGP